MTNKQNGEWYLLAYKGDTLFITVTRSPRGIVRAWHGYSDTVLSTAGGYGYDKESSVLAEACGDFLKSHGASDSDIKAVYNTGAGGVETTKKALAGANAKLYDRHDALGLIYKDIKANNL